MGGVSILETRRLFYTVFNLIEPECNNAAIGLSKQSYDPPWRGSVDQYVRGAIPQTAQDRSNRNRKQQLV